MQAFLFRQVQPWIISGKSSGSLKAVGGYYRGAGIGGDDETSSGNITILSGTVDAVGGDGAAGIGGGYRGTGTGAMERFVSPEARSRQLAKVAARVSAAVAVQLVLDRMGISSLMTMPSL